MELLALYQHTQQPLEELEKQITSLREQLVSLIILYRDECTFMYCAVLYCCLLYLVAEEAGGDKGGGCKKGPSPTITVR